ncbi:hypothetical protein ACFLY9_00790 [Patescibacteria group bacterium]
MKSCLNVFRVIVSGLLCILLFILITAGIPLAALSKVVTNPQNLKDWLDEGGVYDKLPELAIDQIENMSSSEEMELPINIDFSDKEGLVEVFNIMLPKEYLKTNVESVIDSAYMWLKGESEIPDFEIDISERKTVIVDEIVTLAENSLGNLPECTESEMQEMLEQEISPIQLSCLPPDYNTDELREQLEEEINKFELLEQGKIDSKEFFNIDPEITDKIQTGYSLFEQLPVYVMVGILVLTLVIFILIPGLAGSFITTGIIWVLSSSLLLIGNVVGKSQIDNLFQQQMENIPGEEIDTFITDIKKPFDLLVNDVLAQTRQFAIIIVVLGLVLLIGGFILKFSKKRYYVKDDEPEEPEVDLTAKQLNSETAKQKVK